MQTLGVPYEKGYDKEANDDLMAQAKTISDELGVDSIRVSPRKKSSPLLPSCKGWVKISVNLKQISHVQIHKTIR